MKGDAGSLDYRSSEVGFDSGFGKQVSVGSPKLETLKGASPLIMRFT